MAINLPSSSDIDNVPSPVNNCKVAACCRVQKALSRLSRGGDSLIQAYADCVNRPGSVQSIYDVNQSPAPNCLVNLLSSQFRSPTTATGISFVTRILNFGMDIHEQIKTSDSIQLGNASPKRLGSQSGSYSKRSKYSPMACNACKKRKLKCVRSSGQNECQRCIATGVSCVYAHTPPPTTPSEPDGYVEAVKFERQSHEVEQLRQQVAVLSNILKDITEKSKQDLPHFGSCQPSYQNQPTPPTSISQHPREPQFLGHTRPDFSLNIAKKSLTQRGISTDVVITTSTASSAATTPREMSSEQNGLSNEIPQPSTCDPLYYIPKREVLRLMNVFLEEIGNVYPVIGPEALNSMTSRVLHILEGGDAKSGALPAMSPSDKRDTRTVKIALAASMVIESRGKNVLSQQLVDSIGCGKSYISRESEVDLGDIQMLTFMSIYYFHCDEDLLAWRAIGLASRMSLEMGLHRKHSLLENFKSPELQAMAIRTFWCVYALDRRWSFGTGMSFALADPDIDPELPEPPEEFQYLRCLVSHGRLCSRVWAALPPLGSRSMNIPKDQVDFLEYLTQKWISSIPADLQLYHPRLRLAPRNQPRTLRLLSVLLYLRGNHIRTLLYRHHVLSVNGIYSSTRDARLVVDIAKDTIEVLVDLAKTSDVYSRQQTAFNYFLLSALAVILLAVCHAPEMFSESCRDTFTATVELLRGFSNQSAASKRLWKSIQGILPAVRRLELRGHREHENYEVTTEEELPAMHGQEGVGFDHRNIPPPQFINQQNPYNGSQAFANEFDDTCANPEICTSVPDMFEMGADLMCLFDALGQTKVASDGMNLFDADQQGIQDSHLKPEEVSRLFNPLI